MGFGVRSRSGDWALAMIEGLTLYVVLLFGKCEIIEHEAYGEMVCEREYRRVYFPEEAEAQKWFNDYDWSKYHMAHLIRGEVVNTWTGPTQWKDGEP